MPRVDVPAGADPMIHVWTTLAPPLTGAAASLSDAVYSKSSLTLREFEAARVRIAQINDCNICLNWRSARDVNDRAAEAGTIDEDFYAHVGDHAWPGFSERERLAAEFAERYALDHTNMDDELWARLHGSLHRRRDRRSRCLCRVVARLRAVQPRVRHRRCVSHPAARLSGPDRSVLPGMGGQERPQLGAGVVVRVGRPHQR